MKKLVYLFVFFIFNSSILFCQEKSADIIALHKVVTAFEESILEKDSIKFLELFFHDKVAFIGIMSKETEWSIKKDYPDFQGLSVSNCAKFIEEICKSDKRQVENFYKIDIDTDGAIASIAFDYSFYSDEKMIQWGSEKWNLVYAEHKWLITDVSYSIRFPDIEKCPFVDVEKN